MLQTLPPITPVICGPTAGGKSDLAIDLALTLREKHRLQAEIITADAFQIYQGLNIGTAKPTTADQRGIPHHLIDLVPPNPKSEIRNPQSPFTLDDWLTRANQTITALRSKNILPIVVGGTHLYIKALLEGLFEGPEPDHGLRAELAAMDPAARRADLERIDPQAAARIHPNDLRRTIRALEVFRLTGKPISAHQTQWDKPPAHGTPPAHSTLSASEGSIPPSSKSIAHDSAPHDSPLACAQGAVSRDPSPAKFLLTILDWDTDALNKRINARVKQMMDQGLLEEVRALLEARAFTPRSAEALGYKQLIPLVRESIDSGRWPSPAPALEEAIEKIKIETRRFAKNQRTWLRRLSTTPGAIRLAAPPATDAERAAWIPTILRHLNLPA